MKLDLKNNTTIWGLLLIVLGAFLLLQVTGLLGALSDLFWSLAFGAAGAVFLYVFLTGLHTRWWAAIPGFTLLGLAATIFYGRFAPPFLSDITGAVFLGLHRRGVSGHLPDQSAALVGTDSQRRAALPGWRRGRDDDGRLHQSRLGALCGARD